VAQKKEKGILGENIRILEVGSVILEVEMDELMNSAIIDRAFLRE
jgi:hypothetical protein